MIGKEDYFTHIINEQDKSMRIADMALYLYVYDDPIVKTAVYEATKRAEIDPNLLPMPIGVAPYLALMCSNITEGLSLYNVEVSGEKIYNLIGAMYKFKLSDYHGALRDDESSNWLIDILEYLDKIIMLVKRHVAKNPRYFAKY